MKQIVSEFSKLKTLTVKSEFFEKEKFVKDDKDRQKLIKKINTAILNNR